VADTRAEPPARDPAGAGARGRAAHRRVRRLAARRRCAGRDLARTPAARTVARGRAARSAVVVHRALRARGRGDRSAAVTGTNGKSRSTALAARARERRRPSAHRRRQPRRTGARPARASGASLYVLELSSFSSRHWSLGHRYGHGAERHAGPHGPLRTRSEDLRAAKAPDLRPLRDGGGQRRRPARAFHAAATVSGVLSLACATPRQTTALTGGPEPAAGAPRASRCCRWRAAAAGRAQRRERAGRTRR